MKRKEEINEYRQACLANNTCPELQAKPSARFTQCVDGKNLYRRIHVIKFEGGNGLPQTLCLSTPHIMSLFVTVY